MKQFNIAVILDHDGQLKLKLSCCYHD